MPPHSQAGRHAKVRRPFHLLGFPLRLQPESIENRRTVSERIGRIFSGIADLGVGIEAIGFSLTLLFGLCFLGYGWIIWLLHFFHNGQFLVAGLVGVFFITISLAAIARSYLAIAIVLGTAAVCGVAFLSGASTALLP